MSDQISKKLTLQKCKRGHYEQKTSEDNLATVAAWKDNKVVILLQTAIRLLRRLRRALLSLY